MQKGNIIENMTEEKEVEAMRDEEIEKEIDDDEESIALNHHPMRESVDENEGRKKRIQEENERGPLRSQRPRRLKRLRR